MALAQCPYCGASDGHRAVAGGGRFLTECRTCGRIVEERLSEVEELFIERAHDAPFCIVTPDFSENESYWVPPIEDDPFESIGFITAFSTWSLEQAPLFTATSTSFSGQLAELERVLSDILYCGGATGTGPAGSQMTMVDSLRAYFHILEVSSVLGLERDSCDNAIQLFKDCLTITYVRNRNVEALATAALVQALRERQEPRTLQEISAAANIPQKDIGRHIKVLSDALKLRQPINSSAISVHMPRFCNLLQLSKSTQDLATHIGEVVMNKSFCTRRNPISVSAAAIYLACQLEDKRKTQTEICKATSLTEVTLRKVYKELLENLDQLLPPDYTPAVPLERPFPMSASALGRGHAPRVGLEASYSDPSVPTAAYNAAVSNGGLPGDTSSGVGGSATAFSAQSNRVRGAVSGAAAPTERQMAAAPYWVANPSTSDSKHAERVLSFAQACGSGTNGAQAGDRPQLDVAKGIRRDGIRQENRNEMEHDKGRPKSPNLMPAAAVSDLRPSFLPFDHFYSRAYQDMHPQARPLQAYGTHDVRLEEGMTATRGKEGTHKGMVGNVHAHNSKAPQQYVGYLPGMPDAANPSMQVKLLSLYQGRPQDGADRRGAEERDGNSERERDHRAKATEGGSDATTVPALDPATLQAFATAVAAAAASGRPGPPYFPNFSPGVWPFVGAGAPYGVYPHVFPAPGGGFPKSLRKGENQASTSEKTLQGPSQGLSTPAGAEAFARMAGPPGLPSNHYGELPGQLNHLPLPWSGVPFHPFFIPNTPNGGGAAILSNGINETSGGKKIDEASGSDANANVRRAASREGRNLSQQPVADLSQMPGFGGNRARSISAEFSSNTTQQPDAERPIPALNTRASVERQTSHG